MDVPFVERPAAVCECFVAVAFSKLESYLLADRVGLPVTGVADVSFLFFSFFFFSFVFSAAFPSIIYRFSQRKRNTAQLPSISRVFSSSVGGGGESFDTLIIHRDDRRRFICGPDIESES